MADTVQQESRTVNSAKNIVWGYAGSILTVLLSFASRTVFIYTIGTAYLGISGLFTNVLNVLSFSELGIGTAMNYSLYKPVAEGDTEKVKALMRLYKTAYRITALLITVLGLLLLPFLPGILKGGEGIRDIPVYYLIFLFNTVSSYFITYKYGLVNAQQKSYVLTNIDSVFRVIITGVQIVILLVFRNYMAYLLVQAGLLLLQKIATGAFLNRQYPYLRGKNIAPLNADEKNELKTNIKALMIHKFSEISIYQTDNIIIAAFLNITVVGLVSNYNLLLTAVSGFLSVALSGMTAGCGNFIATESAEKQLQIYKAYHFFGSWIYGFTTVCFYILLQPFIALWIGADKQIDDFSVLLILLNYYLVGQRATVNNFKIAGGVFNQDKYASLAQAVLNLALSVLLAKAIGLPGVYIGTLISGLVPLVWKPVVMCRTLFRTDATRYFIDSAKYLAAALFSAGILKLLSCYILSVVTPFRFAVMLAASVVLPNFAFWAFFRRCGEYRFICDKIAFLMKERKKR